MESFSRRSTAYTSRPPKALLLTSLSHPSTLSYLPQLLDRVPTYVTTKPVKPSCSRTTNMNFGLIFPETASLTLGLLRHVFQNDLVSLNTILILLRS